MLLFINKEDNYLIKGWGSNAWEILGALLPSLTSVISGRDGLELLFFLTRIVPYEKLLITKQQKIYTDLRKIIFDMQEGSIFMAHVKTIFPTYKLSHSMEGMQQKVGRNLGVPSFRLPLSPL